MAIASPSARNLCCTAPSDSNLLRFSHPILTRSRLNYPHIVLGRSVIGARLNASSDGELVYELHCGHLRRKGVFPVYVTLPADAVGPTAQTMRRKKAMMQSFRALAAAGVEGVVMELWWGLVEREVPGVYNWHGYLEIVLMAKNLGLKVRAVMAFHHCRSGPDDALWIPLPQWVLEEINKNTDGTYSQRNMEYISPGWDILPILLGRSPVQAYADFMRNFRDTFRSFLGSIITGVRVGLGPGGELRYPSIPTQNLTWAWLPHELGYFQCYDKFMLASMNACAHDTAMHEWAKDGAIGASDLMQNPENTELFTTDGSQDTPYRKFFLEWYSEMLLLHGERICREAEAIFRGHEVNISGKVAWNHFHHGFLPIARMFGRYGFTMSCSCSEVQHADEQQIIPTSSLEGFHEQLLLAARTCDIPLEGENPTMPLGDESFQQVLKISRFYSDGLETPSFSFNFVRMDKNLLEYGNWISFTRFVRQMSNVNMIQASLGFAGGDRRVSSPSAAAFGGAVLAY